MRLVGVLLLTTVMGACLFTAADVGSAEGRESGRVEPKVMTDGRLRPGHLETIRVVGFPGKGATEVAFFPTAICEDGCGARSRRGGKTNGRGAARFRVRIPGTFLDYRNRSAYFRDEERLDIQVTWEGLDGSFAVGSVEPEPVLVRTKPPRHG
jgi:hypothetical protein